MFHETWIAQFRVRVPRHSMSMWRLVLYWACGACVWLLQRLSVEEIMRPGRQDHLNRFSVGSHGEVNPWEAEGSTSRELGSSEPQPSVNLAVGGSGNNSQSAPSRHVHWDRPSLPSGGEGNIHHLESEASSSSSSSQPGVLRGQGVYLQRARMNSSSGIHDEEAGGSRQPLHDERLHYTCETTQQRHRVNEMQERLRSYAGLPSSVDLDRGSFMLSDSSDSYRRMVPISGSANQGLFSYASDDRDADSTSAWPAPSLLQSWGQSNVWEGSFLRGQSSAGPVSVRSSTSGGQNSGLSASETRRSSGRRLWHALSRGTFHRRTSPQTMAALADLEENSIVSGDVEQIVDADALHGSRSLDLEERRRRVRSQVGFFALAECCLACGLIVILSLPSLHMNCVIFEVKWMQETQICAIYFLHFFHHSSVYDQCYRYGHCVV